MLSLECSHPTHTSIQVLLFLRRQRTEIVIVIQKHSIDFIPLLTVTFGRAGAKETASPTIETNEEDRASRKGGRMGNRKRNAPAVIRTRVITATT